MKENRVAHHNISQFWITVIKKHNIIVLWPRYRYTASAGPWFPPLIIIVVLCVWIIDLLSGVNSLSAFDAHVNLCVWNRLFLRNRMLSLCFGSDCLFSCQIPHRSPSPSIGHSHAGLWRTVSRACLTYWLRIWRNLSIFCSIMLSSFYSVHLSINLSSCSFLYSFYNITLLFLPSFHPSFYSSLSFFHPFFIYLLSLILSFFPSLSLYPSFLICFL